MPTLRNCTIAAAVLAGASGCIIEHDRVIHDRPLVPTPPPPPSVDADALATESAEPPPPPAQDVRVDVFYSRLAPYGHWHWLPEHGRVWVPAVSASWRPYTYGHWVLTDWGWTFVSEDPWGWAAYHYGRWAFGFGLGWYWVPDTVWAPAWVSFRWGGGYACWAPLGPAGVIYAYGSPAWVVVRNEHFTQPIASHVIPGPLAQPIVAAAQPLPGTHASPVQSRSFGPPVAQVQAAVGHPLAQLPVRAALSPRPPVTNPIATSPPPAPAAAARPLANPDRSPRPPPPVANRVGSRDDGRGDGEGARDDFSARPARPWTGRLGEERGLPLPTTPSGVQVSPPPRFSGWGPPAREQPRAAPAPLPAHPTWVPARPSPATPAPPLAAPAPPMPAAPARPAPPVPSRPAVSRPAPAPPARVAPAASAPPAPAPAPRAAPRHRQGG